MIVILYIGLWNKMGVYLYPNNTETPLKDAYIGIPSPTSIVLDKSSISLTTVGDTSQLTATIEPTVSDKTITWATSDPTIATVSTTGLVTCITPGECTITATTVNGLTASCSVNDNQGWQPGVNTIAYYPLTTTSTVNDESGNSHTMSQYGGTFGTYQGVDCLNLSTSDYLSCSIPQLPQGNNPITISCWVYFVSNDTTKEHGLFGYGRNGYHASFQFVSSDILAVRTYYDDVYIQRDNSYLGKRLYLTGTSDGTDVKFYINGQMVASDSHSQNMQDTTLYIGKGIVSNGFDGYISNCIVENVAWTQQEVTDYFDLTKSLYGIS